MATKVYGASDDLIEFSGDINDEVGHYGTDDAEHGDLIIFSDGTILEIKYVKIDLAIWGITLLKSGVLYERIEICMDEDADPYSDVAIFKDGLKWAYVAKTWELVK